MNNYGLKLAWRIFFIVLALLAIVFISIQFVHQARVISYRNDPAAHSQTLETYYQSNSYADLRIYLESNGLYDEPYEKYWEAVNGYEYLIICTNAQSSREASPHQQELYHFYKQKLTALSKSCQSENRSLIQTFLTMIR